MPTRRGIIRMTDGGRVAMPQTDVWMMKEEISDILELPEHHSNDIRAAIQS